MEISIKQLFALPRRVCRFFSFNLVLSTSALYELAEWSAAITIGGNVGTAYLGSQGDIWDAQTDIALAGLGCLILYGIDILLRAAKSAFNSTLSTSPKEVKPTLFKRTSRKKK